MNLIVKGIDYPEFDFIVRFKVMWTNKIQK